MTIAERLAGLLAVWCLLTSLSTSRPDPRANTPSFHGTEENPATQHVWNSTGWNLYWLTGIREIRPFRTWPASLTSERMTSSPDGSPRCLQFNLSLTGQMTSLTVALLSSNGTETVVWTSGTETPRDGRWLKVQLNLTTTGHYQVEIRGRRHLWNDECYIAGLAISPSPCPAPDKGTAATVMTTATSTAITPRASATEMTSPATVLIIRKDVTPSMATSDSLPVLTSTAVSDKTNVTSQVVTRHVNATVVTQPATATVKPKHGVSSSNTLTGIAMTTSVTSTVITNLSSNLDMANLTTSPILPPSPPVIGSSTPTVVTMVTTTTTPPVQSSHESSSLKQTHATSTTNASVSTFNTSSATTSRKDITSAAGPSDSRTQTSTWQTSVSVTTTNTSVSSGEARQSGTAIPSTHAMKTDSAGAGRDKTSIFSIPHSSKEASPTSDTSVPLTSSVSYVTSFPSSVTKSRMASTVSFVTSFPPSVTKSRMISTVSFLTSFPSLSTQTETSDRTAVLMSPKKDEYSQLGAGAIFGIVITVLALAGMVALLAFFAYRRDYHTQCFRFVRSLKSQQHRNADVSVSFENDLYTVINETYEDLGHHSTSVQRNDAQPSGGQVTLHIRTPRTCSSNPHAGVAPPGGSVTGDMDDNYVNIGEDPYRVTYEV